MSLNSIWNLFTYIFRIFKTDRRPEYTKVDDEYEYDDDEYDELTYDFNNSNYTFVIVR
jgi:hypothetical protein